MDADTDTTNRIVYTTEPLRLGLTQTEFQFAERTPGCERMKKPRRSSGTRRTARSARRRTSWAAMMNVTSTTDGGRGGKAFMRHEGIAQSSRQAELIKDCIYGRIPRWPWPRPSGLDSLDGGTPRLAIHMRWDKR